jgi:PAS domain S-box-containing protein
MVDILFLNWGPERPTEIMGMLVGNGYSASLLSLASTDASKAIATQKADIIICSCINEASDAVLGRIEEVLNEIPAPVLFIIAGYDERFFAWLGTKRLTNYIKEPFTGSELSYAINLLMRSHNAELTLRVQESNYLGTVDNSASRFSRHEDVAHNAILKSVTEESLKEVEERFRMITENIDDVIWTMDREGNFLYVSPSQTKLTGYSPQEAMQKPLRDKLTFHSFQKVNEKMNAFFADMQQGIMSSSTSMLELEQYRKDGSTVWIDVTVSPIFDDAGNFQFFLGVSRNISERKQFEAELKKQKHVLGTIFEHAPFAMLLVNSEGRVESINHAGVEAVGKQKEDILGSLGGAAFSCVNSFKEGGCGASEGCADCAVRNTFTETFNTGRVFHKVEGNLNIVMAGEISTRHLLISTARIGLNGDTSVMLSLDDITESKKAQIALQESKDRLAILYENMPGGTLIIGQDYVIEDVNSRTCELTGYKREELIGQLCDILCPKGSYSKKCPIWEEGMECFQGMDTTIKCSDGRRNPIIKNATKISIEGKTYILENFQDISGQKEAEEALNSAKMAAETASKIKSEFLASMSHELRTPLNAVIGYSDMLLEGAFGEINGQQRRSLGHILASGKHLLEVINDILDLSKVESGKMELHCEDFSVHDLLKNVGNIVSLLAKKKNISFSVSVQPESLCVNADKVRMKQILYNLVSNAIKFTPEDGYVRIDARERDGMLELSVSDNGIGISEDDQNKLFVPFSQIYSDTSRHYDGTGLGLSLVKKFVEMHDGDITFESETGKGTTFTIRIPLKRQPPVN